jgi:hypothetical protein
MARTTERDLANALCRFGTESQLKTWYTPKHDANLPGTLGFSKSPDGYRLIESVGNSGERELCPRMTARELVRALDLATELASMHREANNNYTPA